MIILGLQTLSAHEIKKIACSQEKILICEKTMQEISHSYELIKKYAQKEEIIYGLNTGFGALAEHRISLSEQETLQRNIILSHAVGVGEALTIEVARTLMLLRLNTLLKNYSGASPALLQLLCKLINEDCAPYIPRQGSVGASGDLAPLAHLGLFLLGLGKAYFKNKVEDASYILSTLNISPLVLGIRDGLALINGTQAMAAQGINALFQCEKVVTIADLNLATSLDALCGHEAAFDERIHKIKAHPGQITTAKNIRKLILGRNIDTKLITTFTQDPYSLRCAPQVHGATRDIITHVWEVVLREINAVTDNPLFFITNNEELSVLSGGNFHGQSLALAYDYLAMAIAELANISERRIELMLNPRSSRGLPPFLISDSGLNSGFMMLHVTASALVSENKILCHPASVDSIPTSANREDHVSMGMISANKLHDVIANTKKVLAIELLAAHQALDFRPQKSAGLLVQQIHESLRREIAFRESDGLYIKDLENTLSWIDRSDISIWLN
jgi:histidine ammonia-lyase